MFSLSFFFIKKATQICVAFICGHVGIRTPNLLIRSEVLYPVELHNRFRGCKDNSSCEITDK